MSRSLGRVAAALRAAALDAEPIEIGETAMARQATEAVGCRIYQIAKSLLSGTPDGVCGLFLTAGGATVDPSRAAASAGAPLTRAGANAGAERLPAVTGFAIRGGSPVGHPRPGPV